MRPLIKSAAAFSAARPQRTADEPVARIGEGGENAGGGVFTLSRQCTPCILPESARHSQPVPEIIFRRPGKKGVLPSDRGNPDRIVGDPARPAAKHSSKDWKRFTPHDFPARPRKASFFSLILAALSSPRRARKLSLRNMPLGGPPPSRAPPPRIARSPPRIAQDWSASSG